MNSFAKESNSADMTDANKRHLLHSVNKKISLLTQTLPELDILDFNLNKSEKRSTLSVSYKPSFKENKRFDLSPLFTYDKMREVVSKVTDSISDNDFPSALTTLHPVLRFCVVRIRFE